MKRILLTLALILWSTQAFATDIVIDKKPASTTAIDAVTLDADPTSVTSSKVDISNYGRLGIYWAYDETQVGGVQADLTMEVSPDGSTWFSSPFFDTAGGATPQTTQNATADGNYVAWMDRNIPFNYARAIVTCTGCDVDDTVLTSVYFYIDRG